MKPKVSVIIPALNMERYLEQAVESALRQTLREIEVIVVDDGSTDRTSEVAASFADPRVRVVNHPESRGVSVARNHAIEFSTGEWIAVLDADDWYAPDRLERLVECAERLGTEMAADDWYWIDDGAARPWTTGLRYHGYRFRAPVVLGELDLLSMDMGLELMVRRDFLDRHELRYRPGLTHGEDLALIFDGLRSGGRLALLPEPLYYYRARKGSQVTRRVPGLARAAASLEARLAEPGMADHPELRAALARRLARRRRDLARASLAAALKSGSLRRVVAEVLARPGSVLSLAGYLPKYLLDGLARRRARRA